MNLSFDFDKMVKNISAQLANTNAVSANPVAQTAVQNTVSQAVTSFNQDFLSTNANATQQSQSSVFSKDDKEDEKNKKTKFTYEEKQANYSEFIQDKNAAGIKTTSLGNGEADFSEYGAALSDELKQEIVNSIDSEEDKILQNTLAGLFTDKNVVQTNDFIAAAKSMGYEVSSEYVSTTYIVDNKADGHYDTDVTNGAINVLTIKDPQTGAEIKIADANGNGAIESEELFMNEILQGISANLDTSYFGKASSAAHSAGGSSVGGAEDVNTNLHDNNVNEKLNVNDLNKTEEEEEAKKAKKAKKAQEAKETMEAKETKKSKNKEVISETKYQEMEDKAVQQYLDKEGQEYYEILDDETKTQDEKDQAQKELDAITKKAKEDTKKRFEIKK